MQISDTYKYNSVDVAYYIVATANERKVVVNMTKIQKLLYIAYGVYLRVYKERLTNEYPQAWPYGPVFPTTRNKLLKVADFYSITMDNVSPELRSDENMSRVLDFTFRTFGTWNAGQLSEWSHSKNSPWDRTVNKPNFNWGDSIPDEYILEYFTKMVKVNGEQ